MNKEYFNVDNIMISDDEMIGNCFKNVTIQTPIRKTPFLDNIMKNLDNLCFDVFLKTGIQIATYELIKQNENDKLVVDATQKKQILQIYASICQHLLTSNILSEEEMSDDLNDIQLIDDYSFWEYLTELYAGFSTKYIELLNLYAHA